VNQPPYPPPQPPFQQNQRQPAPYSAPAPYGAHPGYGPQAVYAPGPTEAQLRGKKLVTWSRLLLLGGVVLLFGGCGGAIALQSGALGTVGGILGMGTIVAAAIVGQIGRGYQGRVI
jgi:hypothetical protein